MVFRSLASHVVHHVLYVYVPLQGSIEHIETVETSSGHTELSLAVLLYDAQQHGYYRRCLQLPDESIQLFRLQPSHTSEGRQVVPSTAAAAATADATAAATVAPVVSQETKSVAMVSDENATSHTGTSAPSDETSNDVLFWLLAKKAQLESSAPST